jgi:hypothetical protein
MAGWIDDMAAQLFEVKGVPIGQKAFIDFTDLDGNNRHAIHSGKEEFLVHGP